MQTGFDVQPLVRQFKALVMRALGGDAAAARQTLGAMGVSDPIAWSTITGKPTTLTGAGYSSSDPLLSPVGSIIDFGGETPPSGWLECDGSSLLSASYPDLFAAIGTLHGAADGSHFNLPDMRGAFARGYSHGTTTNDPDAASRVAAATGGATGDHVGSKQAGQIQNHSHTTENQTGPGGANYNGNYAAGLASVAGAVSMVSGGTGGNQTNPVNISVMFIIKY